jgi:hypothetical protein
MDDVTDKFNVAIEAKIDLATVDFEKKLTTTSVETEKVKTSITAIAEKSAVHEKDWKQWFNRGWGVFFAFTLIFGFLNYVGNKWLDGLDRTVESTASAVKKLDLKVTELENIVTRGGR